MTYILHGIELKLFLEIKMFNFKRGRNYRFVLSGLLKIKFVAIKEITSGIFSIVRSQVIKAPDRRRIENSI